MANTKFKVGDKVRVKEGLKGGNHYDGLYFNHNMLRHCGEVATITKVYKNVGDESRYSIDIDTYGYVYNDDMLEPVEIQFTKANLKDGMVVEYRNGMKAVVLTNKFVRFGDFMPFDAYTDDLIRTPGTSNHRADWDIVKVYTSTADTFEEWTNDSCLIRIVWERGAEEHKEMTVEEIEEKLGYKIKVVADK